ncbi:MAG: zinc metallopeptidase [candidate division KSB1 bacterium]|nr:zinc metallopeptidase [candidate division KSB1 bacterium]MDZ7358861.1 zinc metallopeptidase [candidate division KSB1 bacterium]MDZ7400127.1 zinc metallopeptidase [candidate division KSB1 bacterium]
MRWIGRRQSTNIEDRRGQTTRRIAGGGCGTIILVLIVWLLFGGNPLELLNNLQPVGDQSSVSQYQGTAEENELAQFVGVVLGDTEDVWHELFRRQGLAYREPKLVLFSEAVQSACGYASAATGPFYCPGDEKVYIDLSFFRELQQRFEAPGDFAMAYVIAHEIGHHVQNLLGINDRVMAMRNRMSQRQFNQYLVRLELQADFLAGVWAHHAQKLHNILEEGDVEEAMNAASAVGDDRIMKRTQGYVVPDAFTHGTSEQRVRWFMKGFKTGDINQGDTFNADFL